MPAGRGLPAVTKNKNYPQPVKHLKPMALSPGFSQPMGPLLNEQGEIGYHHDWATIPGDTRDQANDDFCNTGPYSCPQQHGSRPRFPH
jgi:hypothetical protein